jgi:uncharacterized protein (DUF1778 family)
MCAITIRLNDQDDKIIRDYAKIHAQNVSESIRNAISEKIEDETESVLKKLFFTEFQLILCVS